MERRNYKTVFFDLDGTLLPMDMDEFLGKYFKLLNEYAVGVGLDAARFSHALNEGVKSMATDASPRMNDEVFWTNFHALYGEDDPAIDRAIEDFYDTVFPHIGDGFRENPAAARAVDGLREKGYRLFLTTMPLFPRKAVEWRCKWAGIDPDAFDRITTYDNSFACKPSLRYYRHNIELAGCAPEEVLMVGNNTREDLAALELGCDGYLVTDWLLDPVGYPIDSVKHGTLADFSVFAQSLPPCNGAQGVPSNTSGVR